MELELRHLRVVCAVAESGSVTKAAARLGLAQPALTAQLRRIERGLVVRLSEDEPNARVTTLASWSAAELAGQVTAGRLDFAVVRRVRGRLPAE